VGFSDLLICELSQFFAARVHLNGNIAKRRPAKAQPWGLFMVRASNVVKLVQGPPLEFLDGLVRGNPRRRSSNPRSKHESILA
jgi:hypothetical protein